MRMQHVEGAAMYVPASWTLGIDQLPVSPSSSTFVDNVSFASRASMGSRSVAESALEETIGQPPITPESLGLVLRSVRHTWRQTGVIRSREGRWSFLPDHPAGGSGIATAFRPSVCFMQQVLGVDKPLSTSAAVGPEADVAAKPDGIHASLAEPVPFRPRRNLAADVSAARLHTRGSSTQALSTGALRGVTYNPSREVFEITSDTFSAPRRAAADSASNGNQVWDAYYRDAKHDANLRACSEKEAAEAVLGREAFSISRSEFCELATTVRMTTDEALPKPFLCGLQQHLVGEEWAAFHHAFRTVPFSDAGLSDEQASEMNRVPFVESSESALRTQSMAELKLKARKEAAEGTKKGAVRGGRSALSRQLEQQRHFFESHAFDLVGDEAFAAIMVDGELNTTETEGQQPEEVDTGRAASSGVIRSVEDLIPLEDPEAMLYWAPATIDDLQPRKDTEAELIAVGATAVSVPLSAREEVTAADHGADEGDVANHHHTMLRRWRYLQHEAALLQKWMAQEASQLLSKRWHAAVQVIERHVLSTEDLCGFDPALGRQYLHATLRSPLRSLAAHAVLSCKAHSFLGCGVDSGRLGSGAFYNQLVPKPEEPLALLFAHLMDFGRLSDITAILNSDKSGESDVASQGLPRGVSAASFSGSSAGGNETPQPPHREATSAYLGGGNQMPRSPSASEASFTSHAANAGSLKRTAEVYLRERFTRQYRAVFDAAALQGVRHLVLTPLVDLHTSPFVSLLSPDAISQIATLHFKALFDALSAAHETPRDSTVAVKLYAVYICAGRYESWARTSFDPRLHKRLRCAVIFTDREPKHFALRLSQAFGSAGLLVPADEWTVLLGRPGGFWMGSQSSSGPLAHNPLLLDVMNTTLAPALLSPSVGAIDAHCVSDATDRQPQRVSCPVDPPLGFEHFGGLQSGASQVPPPFGGLAPIPSISIDF